MKKITLTLAFFLIFTLKSIGQINPVNNLLWEQTYNFGYYTFGLSWDAPATPHDELIGYNIYRDNELFRFQTQTYLTNMGINPNCGEEFMGLWSDGDGFEIHVTAVYSPGATESVYTETVHAANNLLNVEGFENAKAILYPNPTNGIVNIGNKNLNEILIYDMTGKEIGTFAPNSQIDLSALSKGMYLIKLISDKGTITDKIVIE